MVAGSAAGAVVAANATYPVMEINIPYVVSEVAVAFIAVIGNLLVILAFRRERRLRRRTNYYIVSLAAADLLVGLLGIPCALLTSVGLPPHKHVCLFTTSLLVVLCTISIFSLVAVSVDRYWAILYPMGYSRNVRTKTAIGIICVCWVAGGIVGFLPLFGWNNVQGEISSCFFEEVMSPQFLVFLYFATIIGPATVMAAFYTHIYTVVLKQLKQMVTVNGTSSGTHGSMLRVLGAARKREVKATQNLSIIVLFFMVCWIPLYTINFFQAYYPPWHAPSTVTFCCIILSHLNSAGNPLLYAYHLRDFRAALRSLLFGLTPEKVVGRENTAFQETPTEQRDRLKRVSSASILYPRSSPSPCSGDTVAA
ncbi:adenosine receptor A2a [Homalodisca vitripennis]|nr:adenosine receptor A2a [Homalodisca vitripennis]